MYSRVDIYSLVSLNFKIQETGLTTYSSTREKGEVARFRHGLSNMDPAVQY